MRAPAIAAGSYDTQQFIALQESLLRIPSSREEVRATPSQPKHATDAIMLDADPLQPGISGGHVDASPSSQADAAEVVSTCITVGVSVPPDAAPKQSHASPNKHPRSSPPKQVLPAMQNSGSDTANPLSSGLNDTQVLPSQVYARYAQSVRDKTFIDPTGAVASHTLQDGESGHVRLVDDGYDSGEEPQIIDDDSADELAIETQARAENVTSPTTFSPITPAYAGNKRDARGRIITPATRTPAADLSAFFKGQPKNKVGLSQLFNQTQATSSPMPNAFHSDPIFERPSPDVNMKLQTSPSGRPSSSRTVRDLRDPRDNYISVDESQELRKRRRKVRGELAFLSSSGLSDDEGEEQGWENNIEIARMKRKQAIDKGLQRITAPADPDGHGRRSRRFRTSETVIGLYTPNRAEKQDDAEDLVSDEAQSENGNEQSDNGSEDQYDELSQTIISSDQRQTPKTPREVSALRLPKIKRVALSPEQFQTASSKRRLSSPYYSPIVKVANSQPVEHLKPIDGMPTRPQSPSSSNPAPQVSLSQNLSLSSNTRTQIAATPLAKGIIDLSSIPPAPVPTSQLEPNQTDSAKIDQNVHSSPPILRAQDAGPELDREVKSGLGEDGDMVLERDDDDVLPQQQRTKARISYTVPETSPSSSVPRASNQSKLSDSVGISGPKNGLRVSSIHPSVGTSKGSTPFESARTNLSEDKGNDRRILSQHAAHEHSAQSFHKMTEILADTTPPDDMESVLMDINILNESDEEFRVAVDRPETQTRRSVRRQRVRDRALKEPALQLNTSPSVTSAISKEQKVSKSGNGPPKWETASENSGQTVRSSHATQSNGIQKPPHQSRLPITDMSSSANHAEVPRTGAKVGSTSPKVASRDVADNGDASIEDDQYHVVKPIPSTSNPQSCRRVFTRFNGSTTLYPGSCLGYVDSLGTKLKIRFDDGSLDEVAPIHTRRLELRIGDHVKVDIAGFRKHLYVVQGLKSSADLESTIHTEDTKTDIYGNNIVVLVEKPRASLPLPDTPQTHEIPITSLYITGTMWPQYKDREYIHASTPAEPSTRLQTPVDVHPVKSPPTSRHRRIKSKAEGKFEHLGLLAQGLFSNMCFAISYTDNDDDDAAKNLVSKSITRNGGLVLNEGFDELLSIPGKVTKEQDNETLKNERQRKSIAVLEKVSGLGFTALIADTYSRRKKYLQALALDLPCLSGRWVLDSVAKGRLLPWQRYLLPAGESSHLDGEVRSRTLTSYPNPSTVGFQATFDNKPRLLDGQRIIFVPGSRYAQKWQALTTLILLMGAAKVRRSGSINNATAILQQEPGIWDCVFVEDENLLQARKALSALQVASGSKRAGDGKLVATSTRKSRDAGNVKVVSDESVIQSLILGEFIDSRASV